MIAWRSAMRTSPARFLWPSLTAVGLLLLLASRRWVGLWPDTGGWVGRGIVLQAPLAAACGALAASAWMAGGGSLSAARSGRRWLAHRVPAVVTGVAYCLLGYTIVLVVAWMMSARSAGIGVPSLGYVGIGAAMITTFYGFGSIFGIWFPSRAITPVVVLLSALVAQYRLGYPLDDYGTTSVRPAAVIGAAIAGIAALAAASVVRPRDRQASAWARRLGPISMTGVATAILLLASGSAVAVGHPVQGPRPVTEANCHGEPAVCLWPEHESLRPKVEAALRRISQAAPPGMVLPDRVSENGIPGQAHVGAQSWWLTSADIAESVARAAVEGRACPPDDQAGSDAFLRSYWELSTWLTMTAYGGPPPPDVGGGPPLVDLQQIALVTREPVTRQTAWANERLHDVMKHRCP